MYFRWGTHRPRVRRCSSVRGDAWWWDANAPPDPRIEWVSLRTWCRTLLRWNCCLTSLIQWGGPSFEMIFIFCAYGGSIELRCVAVCPHKIEDSAAWKVLGSTDACSCNLLVGFCWAFCLFILKGVTYKTNSFNTSFGINLPTFSLPYNKF